MRKKKNRPEREQTKIERRVASLSTHDLTGWADQALFGIGRCMSDWSRHGNPDSLEEATLGAEALKAVIDELNKRHKGINV